MELAELEVVVGGVLGATVGVADDAGHLTTAGGDGEADGVQDELGAHVVGHGVPEQPTRTKWEHRGDVQPAPCTGGDVGDVLNPGDFGLYAANAGWRPRILRIGTVVHVMPQPRRSRRR